MDESQRREIEERELATFTNKNGDRVELLSRGVLQMHCPRKCTMIEIHYFVHIKTRALPCPNCGTYLEPQDALWGKYGVVFIPDSVATREHAANLRAKQEEPTNPGIVAGNPGKESV